MVVSLFKKFLGSSKINVCDYMASEGLKPDYILLLVCNCHLNVLSDSFKVFSSFEGVFGILVLLKGKLFSFRVVFLKSYIMLGVEFSSCEGFKILPNACILLVLNDVVSLLGLLSFLP